MEARVRWNNRPTQLRVLSGGRVDETGCYPTPGLHFMSSILKLETLHGLQFEIDIVKLMAI